MKNIRKILLILIVMFSVNSVWAGSINAAAYQTMRAQSYRNNYNRQVLNRPMPYWQAQSRYSTRGRMYQDYANYSRYMNNVNQYNYNPRYRGRY